MQKDTIIEIFYEKHLDQLIDVIASSCPPKSNSRTVIKSSGFGSRVESHAASKPEMLSNICELLCFCVIHHLYRIKCYFLANNAIEKVLFLTRRREKFLVVAAVRFMRTIISRNDEHLLRHIVKNNLVKPIIDVFIENGNRYNMLQSGVLELLEYIRKENLKSLIIYIVDSFWNQLQKFEHLGSIQAFKIKYEQSMENCDTKDTATMVDPRKKIEERALEKEEEEYFNEDRTGSGGLVDYEDDDDDEDYNPPPRKSESSTENDELIVFSKTKRKSPATADSKEEVHELSKKQKLDQRVNDVKVASGATACSTGSHTDTATGREPSPPAASHATDTNGVLDEHDTENETAGPQSYNCLSDAVDTREGCGDDCPSIPASNSSPERVVNGKDVTGSEPYSVR
ncbi:putative serine/threonine-protein phosphatase 4 regulatory subunit [Cocos nucifera]|uniref:Putative serine/threonine-protein phosphatase 4 regulatory subunit n=1 Tax=Cocos nucifera TaxID=13894 RepID=A0A8K0IRK5_COCNU|nr:putative serine/threonine-protein phosphatase 4 regulatory subunit [Cocos nucifera]